MTDKKSEVTLTRRCGRVSKPNVKVPVLSLLTSESDINLGSRRKLTEIYQVKSK